MQQRPSGITILAVLSAIILYYLNMPNVKRAFGR